MGLSREQLYGSHATKKIRAAERREREAVQFRKDAARLRVLHAEFLERKAAQEAAERNVQANA